jgi:phenylpropionate dioxygenase-like ring-hydroxylating dioxygenase large terminal subunit
MTQSAINAIARRKPGHSLEREFYRDPEHYELDLKHVWYREWVYAGHVCELKKAGDFLTVQIGDYSLMVIRGDDGVIRALHNVCRHRGFRICDDASGSVKRRIVCPYHQWSYALDGALAKARSMEPDFEPSQHNLGSAACELVDGMIFVCVADSPPDIELMRQTISPYLAPFDLLNAKVAYETTFVEHGNWKLVMENNRECFHCKAHHSELCAVFPEAPLHSGGGSEQDLADMERLISQAEDAGLPSRYLNSPDFQYRVMRMQLLPPARSMTADGKPAVARQFGTLPTFDIGDVLLYHYPSTWNHFVADHAVTFRILPVSPTETELRTTWLVPGDAAEGVDYDLDNLTNVWVATNAQDTALVERAQRGVASPAYRPGPYSLAEEEGVMQFVDWYTGMLSTRIKESQ